MGRRTEQERREKRERLGGDQPREDRRRERPGAENNGHRRRETSASNERDYKHQKPGKREHERSSSRSDSEEIRERKHRDKYERKDSKECKRKHVEIVPRLVRISITKNLRRVESGVPVYEMKNATLKVAIGSAQRQIKTARNVILNVVTIRNEDKEKKRVIVTRTAETTT